MTGVSFQPARTDRVVVYLPVTWQVWLAARGVYVVAVAAFILIAFAIQRIDYVPWPIAMLALAGVVIAAVVSPRFAPNVRYEAATGLVVLYQLTPVAAEALLRRHG